jgi:hypothetical protein
VSSRLTRPFAPGHLTESINPSSLAQNSLCALALSDITKRVIRDVTGNKEYEFGDGTKAVSAATQDAAEKAAEAVIDAGGSAIEAGAAAKKVLDDSGYQVRSSNQNGRDLPRDRL